MAEKKLNVRLNLKYDSYENWMASSLVLNAGEAAIAYIKTGDTQEVNSVVAPQVLIKIGDGEHTFKDLPFVSAKAADVYGWAKAAVKPEYQASEIKGLEDFIAGEIQDTNTKYKLEQDTNNSHIIRLYSQELGDSEWTEVASITTADTVYDDTQVKADIKANADAIDALELLVGSDSVATQIGNAITALKLSETYAAKTHTHVKADITDFAHNHEMSEVNGLVDALAGKETAGEAAKVQGNLETYIASNDAALALKASQADLEAEATTARAAEKANADAILAMKDGETLDSFGDVETELAKYQLAGDYSVEGHGHEIADVAGLQDALDGKQAVGDYATKAEAQGYADAKDEAIAAAQKAGDDAQADVDALELKVGTVAEGSTVVGMIEAVDGKADDNAGAIEVLEGKVQALIEGTYDDTELRGLISDNADAIDALEQTHATDKAALEASIKSNTDAISLLTNGVDPETVDGVNDLIAYVTEHGTEVTGMKADIKQNADDIDALEGRMDDAEAALGTVDSRIAAAITGANLGQYALDSDLDAAVERVAALETADDVQDGLLAGLRTDVDLKATKAEHDALAERVTTAEGALATVDSRIETAIEELNIDQYATDGELAALDARVVVVEGKAHEHDNKALLDTYTQTETNLADAVAKKHAHENASVLDGISAEKVSAWDAAEQNAKDYAKEYADGLNTAMDARMDAVEGIAATAVQNVTAAADGGLKAVRAEGSNDVVISIDDSLTFILDCGNSGVTA